MVGVGVGDDCGDCPDCDYRIELETCTDWAMSYQPIALILGSFHRRL